MTADSMSCLGPSENIGEWAFYELNGDISV